MKQAYIVKAYRTAVEKLQKGYLGLKEPMNLSRNHTAYDERTSKFDVFELMM